MMHKGGSRIPVAIPFTEGGNLTEPYIKSTDEYVQETDVTYIVQSDNIRVEGHPFKKIDENTPFVNPSRFNVVELSLPDMNKLYLPPYQGDIGLDTTVSVWKLLGVRVDVQGAISPAVSGQQFSGALPSDSGTVFPGSSGHGSTFEDLESSEEDNLADITKAYIWGMEHKQVQMLSVGCKPLLGVYEGAGTTTGALLRKTKQIQDGDMHEFGYGHIDYHTLCADKTMLPVEMCYNNNPTLLPDQLTMDNDKVGDSCFFMWSRSAAGVRHTRNTPGVVFPNNPTATSTTNVPNETMWFPQAQDTMTAGMASSGQDIHNKNYWLNKARGPNNGVLWDNKCFITFVDNLRGHIHMTTTSTTSDFPKYDPSKVKAYLRHVKEFKITVLVRLCKVKLEAKLINWLLTLNSQWLKNLGFQFNVPAKIQPFTNVLQMPEDNTDEENEELVEIKTIKVDCSGHVSLSRSHESNHPLAQQYHVMNPVKDTAPKRAASGGGAKRTTKARKTS
ncbi:MAG: L1 protein [Fish-associated papillomavirus 1]|nr:MAG: L1 protein [Fish-associated papillomavirus 1]